MTKNNKKKVSKNLFETLMTDQSIQNFMKDVDETKRPGYSKNDTVKVVKKPETDEWLVKYYENGKYSEDKTSYHSDKEDAEQTAAFQRKKIAAANESKEVEDGVDIPEDTEPAELKEEPELDCEDVAMEDGEAEADKKKQDGMEEISDKDFKKLLDNRLKKTNEDTDTLDARIRSIFSDDKIDVLKSKYDRLSAQAREIERQQRGVRKSSRGYVLQSIYRKMDELEREIAGIKRKTDESAVNEVFYDTESDKFQSMTVDQLIDEIFECGISSGPQSKGWIDKDCLRPICKEIKRRGHRKINYVKSKLLKLKNDNPSEDMDKFIKNVLSILTPNMKESLCICNNCNETVQELIGETPGITKLEQRILNWAIENNKIPDQFPDYGTMMDELTKDPGSKRIDISKATDMSKTADLADIRALYLKIIYLPIAKEAFKHTYVDDEPWFPAKESLCICNDCNKTFRNNVNECAFCKSKNVEKIVEDSINGNSRDDVEGGILEDPKPSKFHKGVKIVNFSIQTEIEDVDDQLDDLELLVQDLNQVNSVIGQVEKTGSNIINLSVEILPDRGRPQDQPVDVVIKNIENLLHDQEDVTSVLIDESKLNETKAEKQLQMGIEIEKEHTDDPEEAAKIAIDHIQEDPDYYTKLKKMEAGACDESKDFPVAPMKKLQAASSAYYVECPNCGKTKWLGSGVSKNGLTSCENCHTKFKIGEVAESKLSEEQDSSGDINKIVDQGITILITVEDNVEKVVDYLMSKYGDRLSSENWQEVEKRLKNYTENFHDVDENKINEFNDEDNYTTFATGITDKEAADKIAQEQEGTVIQDEKDPKKFMVIIKESKFDPYVDSVVSSAITETMYRLGYSLSEAELDRDASIKILTYTKEDIDIKVSIPLTPDGEVTESVKETDEIEKFTVKDGDKDFSEIRETLLETFGEEFDPSNLRTIEDKDVKTAVYIDYTGRPDYHFIYWNSNYSDNPIIKKINI